MKKTLLVFVSVALVLIMHAQTPKIDSIRRLIAIEKADSTKARHLLSLSFAMGDISPDSLLHYAFEAIKQADKANFPPVQARARTSAGYLLGYTGNFVKAMQLLLEAKAISQKNNDTIGVRLYYFHLGHIYKRQQDYRNAINNYLLAFKGVSISGQPEMNLGYVYLEINQPDSALYYYTRALEAQAKLKVTDFNSSNLSGMGWAHAKKGNLPIARGYISSAEEQLSEAPANYQVTCFNISKYFAEINEKDSSIYYAKKALYVKGGEKLKPNLFNAASELSKLYEGKNADSAYKYLRLSLDLNRELMSSEKTQQLQTLRFEDEIEQQKLALEKQKAAEERKHNLQYAAIALVLLVFIILFFLFSHSVMANQRFIRFLGILALLVVFEFLNLLLHPYIGNLTGHSPVLMLAIMVLIAALLIPLHHKLEHWILHRLVEKNKRIRLEAAKRTIEKLEKV